MANGRPSLPTRTLSASTMPGMHISFGACEAHNQTLPQPREHHRHRDITETIIPTTGLKQTRISERLLRQTPTPTNQISQQQPLTPSKLRLNTQLRIQPGPPPMRDLPLLRKAGEEVHSRGAVAAADQLEEVTTDVETPTSPLDFGFCSPYGLLYGASLPYTLRERAQALAEAEEAEYQSRQASKRMARLTGRMGSMLKGVSAHHAFRRERIGL